MYYTKQQFAVRHVCSTDETRGNICHVLAKADGSLTATNGHVMAIIRKDAGDHSDAYPRTDGTGTPIEIPIGEAKLIPAETANSAAKAITAATKKNKHLPILNGCLLTDKGLQVSSLDSLTTVNGIIDDGTEWSKYPPVENSIPKDNQIKFRIGIGVDVLSSILKVHGDACDNRTHSGALCFEFTDDVSAFRVKGENMPKLTIVGMPRRISE